MRPDWDGHGRRRGGGGQLKIKKDAEVGTGSVEVHSEIYGCSGVSWCE